MLYTWGCDRSRQKAMRYLSHRPAGAPGLGVTPGPAAEPDSGKVSIRLAMRISAVSGSVTAIRCTTPLYGTAIPDAKTTRAAALTSART